MIAIGQAFVLELVVLGRDGDVCCSSFGLRLGARFNLGRHVSRHHFFLDGVVAPEAEHFIRDLANGRDASQGAHLPFLFQLGNAALHVYFHGKISKGIFLMSQALPDICRSGWNPGIGRIGKHRNDDKTRLLK